MGLDPDFQRGHVWTPPNQTRYLEHLLRGGTSSRTLIWNCPGYDQSISTSADADAPKEMVIVYGKQRLTAILGFLHGNVAVFGRLEEHTSELQSLMRISYAVLR